MCNIVYDFFNENKLFFFIYCFYFSMCVFEIINMDEISCEFSFFFYVFFMWNVCVEFKVKCDIFYNIGYFIGKRVLFNCFCGCFWGCYVILCDIFMVFVNEVLILVVLYILYFISIVW